MQEKNEKNRNAAHWLNVFVVFAYFRHLMLADG